MAVALKARKKTYVLASRSSFGIKRLSSDQLWIRQCGLVDMMDQLPELVKTALSSACKSGRSLSWKVQENSKGMLIQLVWKAEPVNGPTGGNTTMVGSNWKTGPNWKKPSERPR